MHPQSDPQNQGPAQSHTPQPRSRRCRHIFAAGRQCGSPCLREEQFCYFHHTTRRPVSDPRTRRPRPTTYELPVPEDRDSIRAAIAQVMHDIANDHIDLRRAGLILYSLQLALCALPKEPAMPHVASSLSAAARPESRRRSHRKSSPVNDIPAEPVIQEAVVDHAYGLIAPEAFLEPDVADEEEDEEYDPGDEVQEDGRLLRNTFGYQLLKEVELYEARQQGYEKARADLLKEGELHAPQSKTGIDIDAAAETVPSSEANVSANPSLRNRSLCHSQRKSAFDPLRGQIPTGPASASRICRHPAQTAPRIRARWSRCASTANPCPQALQTFYPETPQPSSIGLLHACAQHEHSPRRPANHCLHLVCLQSAFHNSASLPILEQNCSGDCYRNPASRVYRMQSSADRARFRSQSRAESAARAG